MKPADRLKEIQVYSKYTGPEEQELAIFWVNPWSKQEEKIATFLWPGHPIEETENVEKMFEKIASSFSRVKRLTEALEFALECCLSDDTVECHYKAKKALEEESDA